MQGGGGNRRGTRKGRAEVSVQGSKQVNILKKGLTLNFGLVSSSIQV